MADITLTNIQKYNNYLTCAFICRTPRTTYNSCALVRTLDDLIKNFGNPFIDPPEYSDLILAYDLVRRNIPVYISSVYDMLNNDDNFNISYNGYTEFMIVDEDRMPVVGYNLKSDIKFIQPIIQATYNYYNNQGDTLDLDVIAYLLDRSRLKSVDELRSLDSNSLQTIYHYHFSINEDFTDNDIALALANDGFELQFTNHNDSKAFVNAIKQISKIQIQYDSYVTEYEHRKQSNPELDDPYLPGKQLNRIEQDNYWYNIHSNNYCYNLEDNSDIQLAYYNAIHVLREQSPEPDYVCLSKIYRSSTDRDSDNNILRSSMVDLDASGYAIVQNILMNEFEEESNSYLFINTPDLSYSAVYSFLSDNSSTTLLADHYNCDLIFGFAIDYINNNLQYSRPLRTTIAAASLVMYNLIVHSVQYLTNPVVDLNISNLHVRSSIPESSALKLEQERCNSMVLFDIGSPSLYGNRSLSNLPNLRRSHISRNFVFIRRLIRDYLETQKFTISNLFNLTAITNYITGSILDTFVSDGILNNYTLDYNSFDRTVNINITLTFAGYIKSLELNFRI
jgi:hypothetical protein